MNVLGIETSCDETSAAVVTNGTNVRSCIIASSRDAFSLSGGVIPEHAA
jgi:N6-L-threonylcarbamoyladenine synthase